MSDETTSSPTSAPAGETADSINSVVAGRAKLDALLVKSGGSLAQSEAARAVRQAPATTPQARRDAILAELNNPQMDAATRNAKAAEARRLQAQIERRPFAADAVRAPVASARAESWEAERVAITKKLTGREPLSDAERAQLTDRLRQIVGGQSYDEVSGEEPAYSVKLAPPPAHIVPREHLEQLESDYGGHIHDGLHALKALGVAPDRAAKIRDHAISLVMSWGGRSVPDDSLEVFAKLNRLPLGAVKTFFRRMEQGG
jgi:hypothetical protein